MNQRKNYMNRKHRIQETLSEDDFTSYELKKMALMDELPDDIYYDEPWEEFISGYIWDISDAALKILGGKDLELEPSTQGGEGREYFWYTDAQDNKYSGSWDYEEETFELMDCLTDSTDSTDFIQKAALWVANNVKKFMKPVDEKLKLKEKLKMNYSRMTNLEKRVSMLEKMLSKKEKYHLHESFIPETAADYFYGPEDDDEFDEWEGGDTDLFEQSLVKALSIIDYDSYESNSQGGHGGGEAGDLNLGIYTNDNRHPYEIIPDYVFTSLTVDQLLTPTLLAKAIRRYLRNN